MSDKEIIEALTEALKAMRGVVDAQNEIITVLTKQLAA